MGDVRVVESSFGGFGVGGGVRAGVTALGHHHPTIRVHIGNGRFCGP